MTAGTDDHFGRADKGESTAGLISDVFSHVSSLLRGEIDLARAEIDRSLKVAAMGAAFLVGAVILAICALNVLTGAIVAGLTVLLAETAYPAIYSALIVGAVYALIAFILVRAGLNRLSAARLAPTRTAKNIRKDAELLKGTLQ
ncbi:MAG: phage holin family protein [Pseudooceanicola sp.]